MQQNVEKIFENKFIRFLFAGGLNVLFSYGCFVILLLLFNVKEIAVTLNFIVSVLFNYNTSSKIVFRDKCFTSKKILIFYAVYIVTYVVNLLHLHITCDVYGINVYLSQFLTLLYTPWISFFLQQKFVFSKKE